MQQSCKFPDFPVGLSCLSGKLVLWMLGLHLKCFCFNEICRKENTYGAGVIIKGALSCEVVIHN